MQRDLTSIIGTILLLSLCIIQLYINPFEMNETVPDKGNSLNQLLLSPYMIIHPPIVFISYGMIALLYASAMAFLITEDKNWNDDHFNRSGDILDRFNYRLEAKDMSTVVQQGMKEEIEYMNKFPVYEKVLACEGVGQPKIDTKWVHVNQGDGRKAISSFETMWQRTEDL